jgi:hypothetical protein
LCLWGRLSWCSPLGGGLWIRTCILYVAALILKSRIQATSQRGDPGNLRKSILSRMLIFVAIHHTLFTCLSTMKKVCLGSSGLINKGLLSYGTFRTLAFPTCSVKNAITSFLGDTSAFFWGSLQIRRFGSHSGMAECC